MVKYWWFFSGINKYIPVFEIDACMWIIYDWKVLNPHSENKKSIL